MDHEELVAAVQTMAPEDLAVVMDDLPEERSVALLLTLEQDHRQRLEATLSFEEGTAGRLMSTDVISVRPNVTLAVVLRWLRRHQSLPSHTDALMVVGDDGKYLGTLGIGDLLTRDPDTLVEKIMVRSASTTHANMSAHEVAALFERRDLISIAVLGDNERLLGRITIDDVVDIIREESDRTLLHSAGLNEDEDLFAPVMPSARRRGFWLGINLLTVFMAAAVIGRFEEVLDKVVALAVVVAAVAYVWFGSTGIALTLAVAMILNLLIAALSGVVIPLVLTRVGIDPALSGAVILTTATDIVGFLSFLGLATLILL